MKNIWDNEKLVKILNNGGVAIMPTDTIYGVVGKALNKETVERIYKIKRREPTKPSIILITELKDLEKFSVKVFTEQNKVLKKYWFTLSEAEGSGPTSIILDCEDDTLEYLHRGTKTLAFRLPAQAGLRGLLKKVGPLVATSANTADQPAAKNIAEARKYFDNIVDLYIDGGEINNKPSKLIQVHEGGSVTILRD